MVSKEVLVGIGIVVGLAVGLGTGFGFSGASSESENDSQVLDMQLVRQMMLDDPSAMQEMILTTMQDSDQMQMMEDMMEQMMEEMKSDPELKKAMMEHMDRMKASKEAMMGQDMVADSMSKQMPFNVNVPISIPMIDGYYNGEKVFFIHTEFSTSDMANMASMMINFPTLHASELQEISSEETGKIYVFTNGIPGSGPYGGGPFMFQIDIFDSIPGQQGYSQFRVINLVTWDDDSTPRILTSLDELLQAQTNGELSIEKSDLVVNAPMIVWSSDDGKEQTASMIQNMFQSMGGVGGEVVNVDVDNYIATFKLKSDKQTNMMN